MVNPDEVEWLIVGDFNLYRKPEDKNRPGANIVDMFLFNSTISFGFGGNSTSWKKVHLDQQSRATSS